MPKDPSHSLAYAPPGIGPRESKMGMVCLVLAVLSLLAAFPLIYELSRPAAHSAPASWPVIDVPRLVITAASALTNWGCGGLAIIQGLVLALNKSYSMPTRRRGDLAILLAVIALLAPPAYQYLNALLLI